MALYPGEVWGTIISEHPVLPSSEGSKAQGPLNLLNMFTLHSKMNMEPKNGRLEDDVPFSNAVILRFYAYFQECLESSEPNTNQQKHIDDVSGKQPMRRTMPCRTNWLLALASSFICTFIMRRSQSKCYDDKTEGI